LKEYKGKGGTSALVGEEEPSENFWRGKDHILVMKRDKRLRLRSKKKKRFASRPAKTTWPRDYSGEKKFFTRSRRRFQKLHLADFAPKKINMRASRPEEPPPSDGKSYEPGRGKSPHPHRGTWKKNRRGTRGQLLSGQEVEPPTSEEKVVCRRSQPSWSEGQKREAVPLEA